MSTVVVVGLIIAFVGVMYYAYKEMTSIVV